MRRYTAASDWNRAAADYAAWLPLVAPYGDHLVDRLAPAPGQRVLDLACGTGEPGLTAARRVPGLTVLGADGATTMVRAARAAARDGDALGAAYCVARGERLPFPAESFDGALCRFGLMLFDRPEEGLHELHRVVRPGGRVALAVWSAPERVLCPALTLWALERYAVDPPLEWPRTFALSADGHFAGLVRAAGFLDPAEERFDPGFTFDSIEHFLALNLTGRFIEKPYQGLSEADRARFRDDLAAAALEHALPDGRIRLTQEAIVVTAVRP
jgi:ubiquinone/menaquinone biosynthesis C-methylase UbiE